MNSFIGGETEMIETKSRGVGSREILYGLAGVLAGLLVLSGVWVATGRNSTPQINVTEVKPYDGPAFSIKDLSGRDVSLADFRGRVVLLNFWATWCEPCKEETPALEAAYQRLKDDGLVIIGVNLLNSERSNQRGVEDVRRFVDQYGVTYPILLDDSGSVGQAYGVAPLPTSIFVDRDGKVRYIRIGPLGIPDVEQVFRRLQRESDSASG
jgi:cytochrome c biogenesis protein CcmG, thiol:disulfide interchange protein DsbE